MKLPISCANLDVLAQSSDTNRPTRHLRQARFVPDGLLIETLPLEATLVEYGLRVEPRMPQLRVAVPATEAFVDDRSDPRTKPGTSRQESLFPTSDSAQQTLDGEFASLQFLFEE